MYVWHSTQKSVPSWFPMTIGLAGVFFALLVLILLSNSLVSMPGIAVELPQLGKLKHSAADKLVVTITRENKIFYNGQAAADLNDLKSRIGSSISQARTDDQLSTHGIKPVVVVCADRNLSIQDWLNLTTAIRELGLDVYLAGEENTASRQKNAIPHSNVRIAD